MSMNGTDIINQTSQVDSRAISDVESTTGTKKTSDFRVISDAGGSNGLKKTGDSLQGKSAVSVEEADGIVDSLKNYMSVLQTSLGFSVNKETDRVIVTITNSETKEVVRQIPAEELVTLQEKMKELTGIIFSETV